MEVYLDSEYARIWSDGNSPLLFFLAKEVPQNPFQVEVLARKTVESKKKMKKAGHPFVYSIVDFKEVENISFEDLASYIGEVMLFHIDSGVAFVGLVVDNNLACNKALKIILQKLQEMSVGVKVFIDFSGALKCINEMRNIALNRV